MHPKLQIKQYRFRVEAVSNLEINICATFFLLRAVRVVTYYGFDTFHVVCLWQFWSHRKFDGNRFISIWCMGEHGMEIILIECHFRLPNSTKVCNVLFNVNILCYFSA